MQNTNMCVWYFLGDFLGIKWNFYQYKLAHYNMYGAPSTNKNKKKTLTQSPSSLVACFF